LIKSMTGYGRAVQTFEGREITAEIRSVNNRYLDCNIKLPRMYSYAEEPIKQLVKNQISRGKVDVMLSVSGNGEEAVEVSLNRPVLESYLAAMKLMTQEYEVKDDISVSVLSKLPDVFTVEKKTEDEKQVIENLLQAVGAALEQYHAMRETEGQALKQDLLSRRAFILELVAKVEERSPVTVAEYRNRLSTKMQEVLENTNLDEGRILTEAAIFADKVAVDEETVRLRSHLDQMQTMLHDGGAVGRKLIFCCRR